MKIIFNLTLQNKLQKCFLSQGGIRNISFNNHHSKKAYGRVEVKLEALGKEPLVQSDQENGQAHNPHWHFGKAKNFLLLPRIKPKLTAVQPTA
jgi:hypothetical protein